MWLANGADLHKAVTIAIAVLIITCPCALGLAVPMVQVLAAGRLFRNGVVMKNGAALERLAHIDTIVFDKTGTLTEKVATVKAQDVLEEPALTVLNLLSRQSSHPFARSIASNIPLSTHSGIRTLVSQELSQIREYPGKGIEGMYGGIQYRLGKNNWASGQPTSCVTNGFDSVSGFSANGIILGQFEFNEKLRSDACSAVARLKQDNCNLYLASGDQSKGADAVATSLAIENFFADCSPAEKSELVKQLRSEGKKVMMVGDGINDTVALAASDVSFAMGDAGDIAANSADFVLMHNKLESINTARHIAINASTIVNQNIALAVVYNLIALPVAFAGFVTPLVAAIAMSISSLLVIGNSMRLNYQTLTASNRILSSVIHPERVAVANYTGEA
jgi:Cu2+-exporting ATPase